MEMGCGSCGAVQDSGERGLASSGSLQVVYTLLKTSDLLLHHPKLDIEGFVKLHKSVDVVVNLVEAAFHAGEPFLQVFYNRNNPGVIRLE